LYLHHCVGDIEHSTVDMCAAMWHCAGITHS